MLYCPTYPQYYYAYDPTKICRTDCPTTWMRDPQSRKCVNTCPNNTFFDPNSDQCVEECPTENSTTVYFGDPSLSLPTCVVAENCSTGYFADEVVGLCVEECSDGQWKY